MSRVVLVLVAGVFGERAADVVVEDLADGHAGIDPHRLHGEHLQRPVAAKAHVAEAGRHVDEQPQPADRRAAFDHRHEVVGFGPLDRPAQVELVRLQHQPLGRNRHAADAIGLPHVEHDLFVDHQFVVQREVVAVGIEPASSNGSMTMFWPNCRRISWPERTMAYSRGRDSSFSHADPAARSRRSGHASHFGLARRATAAGRAGSCGG